MNPTVQFGGAYIVTGSKDQLKDLPKAIQKVAPRKLKQSFVDTAVPTKKGEAAPKDLVAVLVLTGKDSGKAKFADVSRSFLKGFNGVLDSLRKVLTPAAPILLKPLVVWPQNMVNKALEWIESRFVPKATARWDYSTVKDALTHKKLDFNTGDIKGLKSTI